MTNNGNHSDIHGPKKGEEIQDQIRFKRFFTLKEASIYTGKGVFGIRTLIWNGRIPVIRDGRKMLVDKNDLDAYMISLKEIYSLREQDERTYHAKQ